MTKDELQDVRRSAVNASIGVDLMLDEISKAHKRIHELEAKRTEYQLEIGALTKREVDYRARIEDLQARVRDLEGLVEAQRAEILGHIELRRKLEWERDELVALNAEWVGKVKESSKENEELQAKVKEQEAGLEQLRILAGIAIKREIGRASEGEPITQPGEAFIRGIRPEGIVRTMNTLYACPGRSAMLDLPELPNDPWNAADLIGCIVRVLQERYATKFSNKHLYLEAHYESNTTPVVDVVAHQKVGGKWKVFTQIQKRGE